MLNIEKDYILALKPTEGEIGYIKRSQEEEKVS